MSTFEANTKRQLAYLTEQLKCVKEKQCEEVPNEYDLTPDLNFHWGDPTTPLEKANATDFIETKNVVGPASFFIPMDIYKLRLNIDNWDAIKDYSPVLLIDRYKPREYRGLSNISGNIGQREYRKAGYRHEPQFKATENGRISEVNLIGRETFLDIGQENYFIFVGTPPRFQIRARGFGKRQSNSKLHTPLNNVGDNPIQFGPAAYVYLGFRLRLTLNDGDSPIETGHIAYLKMQTRYKSPDNWELTYKIQ